MNDDAPENMAESETLPPVNEPLFNVPPLTMGLVVLLLTIHLIRLVRPEWDAALLENFVFAPTLLTEFPLQQPYRLLTYALLHIGWLHLTMNIGGLLAFGSGVEKIMGRAAWIIIMIGGCLVGVLVHWAIFPHSMTPMAGASAGLSALFGALLPFLARDKKTLWKLTVLFILINLALGLVGMADQPDAEIAWQAHLGGFIFGLAAGIALIKKRTGILGSDPP